MEDLIKRMTSLGVIPVIKLDSPEDALPLAAALKKGGLCAAEITFRTDAAEEAIKLVSANFPDFLLIAGTVLTPEQADRAMKAGAQAIVSPGLNPAVVSYCIDHSYPVIPGVCTPSEIETGLMMGLEYLKFFPAEAAGGVKMIKALSAPYPNVRFMPTGGINAENICEYLACGSVFACGGSWMVPHKLINEKRFAEIEDLAAEAVEAVKEARK
ncbi:MAG: bifunctional 4-hydroxy-2-oxoglutarate aldolase/2-dehydro-3-deoxy-phosphogluconate aldolase [Clostridia bacterium]|nr:bifunctional 4-hydroxy-2-oxoglutarate aldolase/2-dehydro-3-deoxy-phosphogluconate aldolase [Clostridia bacterium]